VKKRTAHKHRILITAGPTIEPLDPVRYISNFSTGTMGYKIAEHAKNKGYKVCLISGPVELDPPRGVQFVRVDTARQMKKAIMENIDETECIIMAAAVCDFRPKAIKSKKIKKQKNIAIELTENPDILKGIKRREGLFRVGFALETENIKKNALDKLREKKLDLIIANKKTAKKDPFGNGNKNFILIDRKGVTTELKDVSKDRCAREILKKIKREIRNATVKTK